MNTAWTSELQASWFSLSPHSSADEVIDILKNDLIDENDNVAVKYLISDGYAGYDAGIKGLNQIYGVFLKSCSLTHGRCGLWKYLRSNGLLDICGQLLPEVTSFFDFKDNLEKFRLTKKGKEADR